MTRITSIINSEKKTISPMLTKKIEVTGEAIALNGTTIERKFIIEVHITYHSLSGAENALKKAIQDALSCEKVVYDSDQIRAFARTMMIKG